MIGNGCALYGYQTTGPTAANGIWAANDINLRITRDFDDRQNVWPQIPADPNFASVTGLWHFNEFVPGGAAGSNAQFIDRTTNGNNMVGAGTGQPLGTFYKWGPYSMCSSSFTSGCGVSASSSVFQFGTSDFTLEFWCYVTDLGTSRNLIDMRSAANQVSPVIYYSGSSLRYFVSNADRITGGANFTTGAWHFIALTRSGTSTVLYLNGTQQGTTYTDSNNYNASNNLFVGVIFNATTSGFKGNIQDLRLTKGVARYTGASHTVPTAPFPDY